MLVKGSWDVGLSVWLLIAFDGVCKNFSGEVYSGSKRSTPLQAFTTEGTTKLSTRSKSSRSQSFQPPLHPIALQLAATKAVMFLYGAQVF